ncbi:MAG: osmotically-inducible protein OsmY [Lentisphaeria bacterium]|jgi:osmotically-inducible protein OsmY
MKTLLNLIHQYRILSVLIFSLLMSACVTVIDATSEAPIQTDPSKRSFGGYIDDKQLQTIVAVNLKKASPELDEAHINTHSYNSVILLTGEVPSSELRELAGTTARQISRVRQVYNELTIGAKSSFSDRANDNWIHSKIRTKLLLNRDINSGRVEIIVENGVVYLMGLLTQVQTEKVTDVVRTTKGVKKVVRTIEYI